MPNSIASGNLHAANADAWAPMSPETLEAISRAALVHGFGRIILYSGIAVWVLAGVSLLIFSDREGRNPDRTPARR
ncbi:transporter (plasmid) [Ralstonia solanacearum]|nr:transporter [Ralstonia solanacearum]